MSLPANATYPLPSAAGSTNATLIQAGNVYLRKVVGYNASGLGRWLKLYDKATAPDQNDTPRKAYYLPPQSGFAFDLEDFFAAGLGFRLVTGSANNDNVAVTAGDILGLNLDYR